MGLPEVINGLEECKNKKMLILTHHNADPDAIASSLVLQNSLRKFGIKADVGVAQSISSGARPIACGHEIKIDPELGCYECMVIVDTPSKEQLLPAQVEKFSGKIIIIDHHEPGNLGKIADTAWIRPEASSSAILVHELVQELGIEITKSEATLLLAGIVADTSKLVLADTNTFKRVVELLEKSGKTYGDIVSMISKDVDISERIARLIAASRMHFYRADDLLIAFSHVASFEASAARALIGLGADVAIVGSKRKNKGRGEVRISGRLRKNVGVNLAEIFDHVGPIIGGSGGGHATAASANGTKPEKLEAAFAKMRAEIGKALGRKLKKIG